MPRSLAKEMSRSHQEMSEDQTTLDAEGKVLVGLLMDALQDFLPEIGASPDDIIVTIQPHQVKEVGRKLRDHPQIDCDFLRCLSVVDYEDHFEIVYHLYSMKKNHRFVVKSRVPYDDPHLPSVIAIWPGADWYEREGHDLFGVIFDGHPNLSPLILYEGFMGYPGRRSYPFHEYQEW